MPQCACQLSLLTLQCMVVERVCQLAVSTLGCWLGKVP